SLKNSIFCFPIDCECPHSLLDRLLKSVDRYRVRAAYSTQSLVFVKQLNRSFYCLLTLACCAVSVRAHYREPPDLRKGFFDIFMKKGDFGQKTHQSRHLLIFH
ncbi:hypothetical protein, partial [Zobellella taiwanensis]|uniref:hypothetical protein n=1 Tax=Zobellella taiwanensis TaxID=347535 RepID=UPI001C63B249